jgi:tetratricopeptide (TPR) repeat protein
LFLPGDGSLLTSGARGLYRWPLQPGGADGTGNLQLGPAQRLNVQVAGVLERVACDATGHQIAVVDFWQKVIVVNPNDQGPRGPGGGERGPVVLAGHDRVTYLALSPDGRWAATGTFKGSGVKLWRLDDGRRPKPAHAIPCATADVSFSPDGRWLVVMNDEGHVLYRVESWEPARAVRGRNVGGAQVAFAARAPVMAVPRYHQRHLALVDPETGREFGTFAAEDSDKILALTLSADGGRLAAATAERTIQVWDLREVRRQLAGIGLDWGLPTLPEEPTAAPVEPMEVHAFPPDLGSAPWQLGWTSFRLALNPFDVAAYVQRARTQARLKRIPQAIEDYSTALVLMPARARSVCLLERSFQHQLLKHYEAARRDLVQALALDPSNAIACNNLAQIYLNGPEALRDPERGRFLAEAGVALAPDNWFCRNSLGVACYRLGRYREAVAALEHSLRQSGGERAVAQLFVLAMCHARMGNRAEARRCYEDAVRWQPARPNELPPNWAERTEALRAEAESVLRETADVDRHGAAMPRNSWQRDRPAAYDAASPVSGGIRTDP